MIWLLFYTTGYLDYINGRFDVVFDHYFDRSFKKLTQISRGTGERFKITELSEHQKSFEKHITQMI